MGLKENMKYYSEVYLMLIALCCVFVIGYGDYQDYVDEQSREGITSEVNTSPLTEYPPTCANNTRITQVPKPTLVTGYNHSEKRFWYPLGTWITPTGNWSMITRCNYTSQNVRLWIDDMSNSIDITHTLFGANISITNSSNIVIAYANITTNINITNLTGFKLLGNNNALYYLNETPVSETVVNDTIVFSPLVEEPKLRLKLMAAPDDNIRCISIPYNYAGKQWKYYTVYGATCHEIPCEFPDTYCLECEEINERD